MLVSIFNDVIGPVMRGPSSSHCAAALRIGRLARDLIGGTPETMLVEFDRAGYNLIALSRDTCGSHRRYAAAKKILYVLASDPDDRLARAAGSLVEKSMYGRKFVGPARSAFVLDRDGTVLAVVEKIDPPNHAAQLLALIETL